MGNNKFCTSCKYFENDNNASYLKETYGIDLSKLISTEMTDRVKKGG